MAFLGFRLGLDCSLVEHQNPLPAPIPGYYLTIPSCCTHETSTLFFRNFIDLRDCVTPLPPYRCLPLVAGTTADRLSSMGPLSLEVLLNPQTPKNLCNISRLTVALPPTPPRYYLHSPRMELRYEVILCPYRKREPENCGARSSPKAPRARMSFRFFRTSP